MERSRARLVRYAAPAYSFTTLDGKSITAAGSRGQVIVLDFWATWCAPCLQEWPELNAFIGKYRGRHDVGIYAIASREGESLEDVRRFLRLHKFEVTANFDADGTLTSTFHVHGMPTLILIDPSGNVRYLHAGYDARSRLFVDLPVRIQNLLSDGKLPAKASDPSKY